MWTEKDNGSDQLTLNQIDNELIIVCAALKHTVNRVYREELYERINSLLDLRSTLSQVRPKLCQNATEGEGHDEDTSASSSK